MTLRYFDGCPNWEQTDAHLRELARELPGLIISRTRVETPDEADRVGFRGSPTVLLDGVDPFIEPDAPIGLSCGIYQTPQGSAGSPTLEQLRDAILAR